MSLFSDPGFLKRCDELKARLGSDRFTEGSKVARGYADLGYEEFLILPNQKLLSLYSAKVSEIPEGHAQHFFWVPTASELLDEIAKLADISGLDFVDQRTWVIRFRSAGDQKNSQSSGTSFEAALLEAFFMLTPLNL